MILAAFVALFVGALALFEARGRDWAAWGVVALAVGHLLTYFKG